MDRPRPNIFTIPASSPFLPTLVTALLSGKLIAGFPAQDDPLALAQATLYLPTRRACRLAQDVFRDAIGGNAAILPRIVPIGDIDEDEIVFAELATGAIAEDAVLLPRAIEPLERRLLLAQLIAKWIEGIRPSEGAPLVAGSPAAALALADDLARLFDDMTTRKVEWNSLDGLVPSELDKYWEQALALVKLVRQRWPHILEERGAIDAADRRDRLIAAEVARLKSHPGPVIAAGSTGSMPATAMLLETTARLPHGAVVLPGLDTHLDEASWALIAGKRNAQGYDEPSPAFGHPQFAMQALLQKIGIGRDAVIRLTESGGGREWLLSEAMRPAATSEEWRRQIGNADFSSHAAAALKAVSVMEAANAEEEALAIAVALREAVETKDKTAALVTPDRGLARRVLAALARWNIAVDDSGGDPLSDTSAGVFARLVADCVLDGLAPVKLLALLKHPLLRLGTAADAHHATVAVLELATLRGPRPRAGTVGLAQALASLRSARLHRNDPRIRLPAADIGDAARLVEKLRAALAPMEALAGRCPLSQIAACHREAVANLTRSDDGRIAAFAGRDGEALADLFDAISEPTTAALFLRTSEYAEAFRTLAGSRVVRRPGAPGSRVRIFGPLEARLQRADRVVLAGLNEGSWPPETRGDPWLNRPMRRALGLDLPERRIGLSAHDFAQMLGAPEIFLTRAAKVAGAPTVASRFLQRLAAVAGQEKWNPARARGAQYLVWARALDTPVGAPQPCMRPEPKPPLDARPKQLSVTEIEHWLRDPYTIYAKHILRLAPLDPVDTPPGARDRGSLIHESIAEFAAKYAKDLPADPAAALIDIGRERFKTLDDFPEARAFWWPRFERIAHWLAGFETRRRTGLSELHVETRGALDIPLPNSTFRLTGIADRIERRTEGSYAILDYKTGAPPTEKQVRTGLSPQLTLEAAILRSGGFPGIDSKSSVSELVYVAVRGRNPPGEELEIGFKQGGTPDDHADRALEKLTRVAAEFALPDTPYRSLVHPMWKTQYGDYDHLARVKEWSIAGDDEEGGEVE